MNSLIAWNIKWSTLLVLLLVLSGVGPAVAETTNLLAASTTGETNKAQPAEVPAVSGAPEVKPAETPHPATSTNAVHVKPETRTPGESESVVPPVKAVPKAKAALPARSSSYRYRPSGTDVWHDDLSGTTVEFYRNMHEWLGDRLHIGISSMKYEFDDDLSRVGQGSENYFVGTIDELQDIQDESYNITIGIYLNRNFGLEYRTEEVRARTFTDSENNHSDGDFVVEGRVISAVVRLPLDQVLYAVHYVFDWSYDDQGWAYDVLARFVPYVGIGFDSLHGSFDADAWWAHGYSSPASWESLGSPPDTIRNSHVRELRVSDDIGRYELYGISVRIVDHLYVDMNWARVEAEIGVDYYLDNQYRSSGVIPMDYVSQSVGVRYFF